MGPLAIIILLCFLSPFILLGFTIYAIVEVVRHFTQKKVSTTSYEKTGSGNSSEGDYSGMSGSDFAPKVPGHDVYRSGEYGGGPHSVNIGGQDCEIISTPGVYSDTTRVHHQGTGYGDSSKDYDIDSRGNVTVHDKYGGY